MEKVDYLDGYDPVAAGEQDENGIDLESVRFNLRLTPTERYERFMRRMKSVMMLLDAARTSRSTPPRSGSR